MEIDAPTINLSQRTKADRRKLLTKVFPNLARDAESDCRQVIKHYDQVINGEFWKEVATSEEQYFLDYYNKPKTWFENIKEKLLLIPNAYSPKLGEIAKANDPGRPEGSTKGSNSITLAKAEQVATLRAQGMTQKEVGEEIGESQQRISQLENLNIDTRNKGATGTIKSSNTPPPTKRGTNSKTHTIARLKRDGYADLAQQVESGQLPAAAARRQAGFPGADRKNFSVGKATNPQDFALKLADELPREFLVELTAALNDLVMRGG